MCVCETSTLPTDVGVSKEEHYKLAPQYYGPFKMLEKIGDVVYPLNLPESSQAYPVFHVSVLKKQLDQIHILVSQLPPIDAKGIIRPKLEVVLD